MPPPERSVYDNIAPIDFRYWDPEAAAVLGEESFTKDKAHVEAALALTLTKHGLCSREIADEIRDACVLVTAAEVYEEEKRTKHDIRALVNCICRHASEATRPFVHFMATSYDIIDTANARRYRRAMKLLILPRLRDLLNILIDIAEREAKTPQIGRTHGQHAIPITFGLAIAVYVSRLGGCLERLANLSRELTGKFSGAVGAYNAQSLFVEDPQAFERDLLTLLDLPPAQCSTQIVPPEPLMRLISELMLTAGIVANLADDMRHLQRTEIDEVREAFDARAQVGSSTMSHKENPITFENMKSVWKIVLGRFVTVLLDQLSEHQRDLTNSASGRTTPELMAYVAEMLKRAIGGMKNLRVESLAMCANLSRKGDQIAAEPLQLLLSKRGFVAAHEAVRQWGLQARRESTSLMTVAKSVPEAAEHIAAMDITQRELFEHPARYTGIATEKANRVALFWRMKLVELKEIIERV